MKPNALTDLWERVAIGEPDECWPWLGGVRPNGYGQFTVNYRNLAPHRVAYELSTGIAPGDLLVCHTCDNPPCCNPAHLFLGTSMDNTADARSKGRLVFVRGSRHGMAKLTEAEARAIRERRAAGERATDLAIAFRVSKPTITRIVKREGWVHA